MKGIFSFKDDLSILIYLFKFTLKLDVKKNIRFFQPFFIFYFFFFFFFFSFQIFPIQRKRHAPHQNQQPNAETLSSRPLYPQYSRSIVPAARELIHSLSFLSHSLGISISAERRNQLATRVENDPQTVATLPCRSLSSPNSE